MHVPMKYVVTVDHLDISVEEPMDHRELGRNFRPKPAHLAACIRLPGNWCLVVISRIV